MMMASLLLFAAAMQNIRPVAGLTPPDYITPLNDSTTKDGTPRVEWTSVVDAIGYKVALGWEETQICVGPVSDPCRSRYYTAQIAYEYSTSDTWLDVPDQLDAKKWYWDVGAVDSTGFTSWRQRYFDDIPPEMQDHFERTGAWYFKVLTTESPSLLSPTDGSTVSSLRPEFYWTAMQNADEYRIQIDVSSSFNSPIVDEIVSDAQFSPHYDLTDNEDYCWRVSARYSTNTWSPPSEPFHFSVDYPEPILYHDEIQVTLQWNGVEHDYIRTITPEIWTDTGTFWSTGLAYNKVRREEGSYTILEFDLDAAKLYADGNTNTNLRQITQSGRNLWQYSDTLGQQVGRYELRLPSDAIVVLTSPLPASQFSTLLIWYNISTQTTTFESQQYDSLVGTGSQSSGSPAVSPLLMLLLAVVIVVLVFGAVVFFVARRRSSAAQELTVPVVAHKRPKTPTKPSQPSSRPTTSSPFCPDCGTPTLGAPYCSHCGKELT